MTASSLAAACLALASLLPPARQGVVPRSLLVLGEQDQRQELRATGAPTLLLPIFTRCAGICPLTAYGLKEALARAQARFRVVLLSFDDEDTAADLRGFRERLALPSEWLLVRAADPAAVRAFFDDLDFHFMKAGGGFDHPNATFVLSPAGAWAATFVGTAFSSEELDSARRRALAADDQAAVQRVRGWLIRPDAWIVLACAGVAASLAAILRFARRPRAPARPTRE